MRPPVRRLAVIAAVLALAWLVHPLIPSDWAQPARHFVRELLRAIT